MREVHKSVGTGIPVEYVLTPVPTDNDRLCSDMAPGSLIVNATGLGKDRPGSPLTDRVVFPQGAYVWDFNYRGDLLFLEQAGKQRRNRDLVIEDGWVYFLHGWTRVISEIFDVEIPTSGPVFDHLSNVAIQTRAARKDGS